MKKSQRVKKFNTMLVLVLLLLFAFGSRTEAKAVPKINCKKVTLIQGKKKKLKVSGVSAKKVRWISKNNSIATVSRKGVVRAKKKGNTVIIAKVGKKKFRCKVTVQAKTTKKKKKKKHKKDLYDVADDKVNAVIKELFGGHPEKYSEVERAYKIANWICSHTKYSKKNYTMSYDGKKYDLRAAFWVTPILKGTAKCSGFADLYTYMGWKVKLKFKTCISRKENHEISMVQIDGKYYWIDLSFHAGESKPMIEKVFQSKYARNWNYLKSFSNIELCTSRRFDDLHYEVTHKYYKVLESSNENYQKIEVNKKEFEKAWDRSAPENRLLSSTQYGTERKFYPESNDKSWYYYETFIETNMYERGDYMNY